MNIIIFDQAYNNNHIDYIKPLVDNIDDLNAIIFDDLSKAITSIERLSYDFAIVDFSSEEGSDFLKYILKNTPEQKIITLSYDLISSDEDCNECQEKYHKRRLIKPIDALDVYNTIQNFENKQCKYYKHFENPSILVKDMIKRFDYFCFNEETKTIEKYDYENDLILKEYIDIVEMLKKYDISHDIIDEYKVKIC